jgi:hypothetical protein
VNAPSSALGGAESQGEATRSELLRSIVASLVRERRELLYQGAPQPVLDANTRALSYWSERFRATRLPV